MHQQNSWVKDLLNPLQNYQHETCNSAISQTGNPPTGTFLGSKRQQLFWVDLDADLYVSNLFCDVESVAQDRVRCVWLVTSARKKGPLRWGEKAKHRICSTWNLDWLFFFAKMFAFRALAVFMLRFLFGLVDMSSAFRCSDEVRFFLSQTLVRWHVKLMELCVRCLHNPSAVSQQIKCHVLVI